MNFETLYAITVPVAVLAPWAMLAPFLGFTVGVELSKMAERRVIQARLARACGRYVAHGRAEGWWL